MDRTSHIFYAPFAEWQAQPCALILARGHKVIEYRFQLVLRNAGTVIPDRQGLMRGIGGYGDGQGSGGGIK